MAENNNVIYGINGPVITVKNASDFFMQELVLVGEEKLVGEVIEISESRTVIQVYEVTTGLKCGQPVYPTGHPMSVTLGPGIISNIFDGIERPLPILEQNTGAFIGRGSTVSALDEQKTWSVSMKISVGDELSGGDIYAECP